MFSFIIQLLIISVVGLMVQSAPVSDNLKKRGTTAANVNTNVKKLEQRLLCAASSIRNAKWLDTLEPHEPIVPQSGNYTELVHTIFDQFSLHCKGFTNATSLKYHVQDLLFDNNTTPQLSYENLSKLLIKLQTMATTLDDIQYIRDHSSCVRLTAAQYRIMYYAKFEQDNAAKDFMDDWARNEEYYSIDLHCQ